MVPKVLAQSSVHHKMRKVLPEHHSSRTDVKVWMVANMSLMVVWARVVHRSLTMVVAPGEHHNCSMVETTLVDHN